VGGEVDKGQAAASLRHFLVDQTASFYSYLLGFVTLWVIWRSHHRLTDALEWMSPAAISWHLPLLMLIGFLPYATATEGHLAGNPVAALLRPHPGSAPAVLVDRDDRRVPRRCAEPRY